MILLLNISDVVFKEIQGKAIRHLAFSVQLSRATVHSYLQLFVDLKLTDAKTKHASARQHRRRWECAFHSSTPHHFLKHVSLRFSVVTGKRYDQFKQYKPFDQCSCLVTRDHSHVRLWRLKWTATSPTCVQCTMVSTRPGIQTTSARTRSAIMGSQYRQLRA